MASKQVEQHLTAGENMRKKDIVIGNFLGGVAWGLGTVVGATVIIGVGGAILNAFGLFDGVKGFFEYYRP